MEMLRERIWILASDDGIGTSRLEQAKGACYVRQWRPRCEKDLRVVSRHPFDETSGWPKPLLRRGDDGLAYRVDRIKAIGNGQVPSLAALAWQTLIGENK
jgi:DNA (cytosine-5)-methyltransferase 1